MARFLCLLVILAFMPPASAADMATVPCRNWASSAGAFYQGPNDPLYKLYEDGQRWIIGQVIGSPIWDTSEAARIINGRLANRTPLTGIIELTQGITDAALDYCHTYDLKPLSAVVNFLLKDK